MKERNLEPELRAEIEWAIHAVGRFGDVKAGHAQQVHAAIAANSPFLPQRLQLLVDSARPFYNAPPEDLDRLGELMIALAARDKGLPWRLYQPYENPADFAGRKSTTVQFRCSESFKLKLRAYCQRSGVDASALIRDAVEAHLADNPLWGGRARASESDEDGE